MRILLLLLTLLATQALPWSRNNYSDNLAPVRVQIPAALCVVSTPATNWDLYSLTDPTPTCVTGTVIKKGALVFNNAGTTCTSTTATTGCAFRTIQIPADWPSAASGGRVDATVSFTSTDTTSTHTSIWKLSTACVTPVVSGVGTADNPAAMNAADTLTYTVGSGEVSGSARKVTKTTITMTGCTGGDWLHVRMGRDTADTATDDEPFVSLELIFYLNL